jgi:hypothetical protein
MPVGSAPVVENLTAAPMGGTSDVGHVSEMTAGDAIVIVQVSELVIPVPLVRIITLPGVPVPVDAHAIIAASTPAVFTLPAATFCVRIVCATGEAASAAPNCRVAAALRDRNKSLFQSRFVLDVRRMAVRLVPSVVRFVMPPKALELLY